MFLSILTDIKKRKLLLLSSVSTAHTMWRHYTGLVIDEPMLQSNPVLKSLRDDNSPLQCQSAMPLPATANETTNNVPSEQTVLPSETNKDSQPRVCSGHMPRLADGQPEQNAALALLTMRHGYDFSRKIELELPAHPLDLSTAIPFPESLILPHIPFHEDKVGFESEAANDDDSFILLPCVRISKSDLTDRLSEQEIARLMNALHGHETFQIQWKVQEMKLFNSKGCDGCSFLE